jgi:outer membrane protein assembly factor BamD (BamD/ComL family)
MRCSFSSAAFLFSIFFLSALPSPVWAQEAREPRLIRDTDVAEGKNDSATDAIKEPNPLLAAQNVKIGNYYLKQKNYAAAIKRFLEALEYQADLASAYEGLAQAYEKNGQILKAVETYKGFLEKYPNASKVAQFRSRLVKLERKK